MKKILIILVTVIIGYFIIKSTSKQTVNENPAGTNSPNSAENAPPGSIHNLPVPAAVSAARTTLALRLTIPESQILILEAIETQWPNACLGIAEKDAVCAQVITPGYKILMQANGKEYRYRTNESGSVVKAEN